MVRLPIMAMCTRYNIMWHGSSVTCDRSVVFSGESGFPHKEKWPPRCNWNIESGVKHNNHTLHFIFYIFVSAVFVLNIATRFLGPRKLILIGSFICSGAYLLNAYVPGVAVLFISHGILYGKIQNVISYIFCSEHIKLPIKINFLGPKNLVAMFKTNTAETNI
jgi:hypothetical protein